MVVGPGLRGCVAGFVFGLAREFGVGLGWRVGFGVGWLARGFACWSALYIRGTLTVSISAGQGLYLTGLVPLC